MSMQNDTFTNGDDANTRISTCTTWQQRIASFFKEARQFLKLL
jgi:hypothetical protein